MPTPPKLQPETRVVTAGRPPPTPGNPVNTSITLNSTYVADPSEAPNRSALDYGRGGNDTWAALESALGELEGGTARIF
ncbi:MAG: cystathionine gamma-synthase, partial [Angustibacter sp.]